MDRVRIGLTQAPGHPPQHVPFVRRQDAQRLLPQSPMFRDGKAETDVARFRARAPLRRLGRDDEIAAAVAYLLGPDASWVSGQILRVNGAAA